MSLSVIKVFSLKMTNVRAHFQNDLLYLKASVTYLVHDHFIHLICKVEIVGTSHQRHAKVKIEYTGLALAIILLNRAENKVEFFFVLGQIDEGFQVLGE